MSNKFHIAVDAMGGDLGPRLCVPASQKFLRDHPDVQITLVGDEAKIKHHLIDGLPRIYTLHTNSVVEMSEKPSSALRRKSDSSMAQAIRLLSDGHVQACVSAGNTGALMAFGLKMLGTLDGVQRPAICKALPANGGDCWVLDLGAELDCSAEQLLQYAQMANVIAINNNSPPPRIGLLNVGAEAQKGRSLQQEASVLLKREFGDAYIGFVEGGDIFRGGVDIVVCDGFTGNVLLKVSEGAAELLQSSLDRVFKTSIMARLIGILARPLLLSWRREYDACRFNGALFLGFTKVLVKSHGDASEEGFISAISVAYRQLLNQSVNKIQHGMHV